MLCRTVSSILVLCVVVFAAPGAHVNLRDTWLLHQPVAAEIMSRSSTPTICGSHESTPPNSAA